jgi:hypothetical protein
MVRLATCLYTAVLRLYPQGFQERFGAEMCSVFGDVIRRAAERGMASLVAVCTRELWDLVRVLIRERRYQRRQRKGEAMSDRAEQRMSWTFWARWIVASAVGAYLGTAVTALVGLVVAKAVGGGAEDSVPGGILLGAGLGIAQWLVLRRRLPGAEQWMWASIAGAVVFSVLRHPLLLAVSSIPGAVLRIGAFVDALALGASIGFAQWLVLRRHVSRSGWWLVACVGGYGIATLPAGKGVSSFGEVMAFLVVPPAITGLALVSLFRRPRQETPDPAQRTPETDDRRPTPPQTIKPIVRLPW